MSKDIPIKETIEDKKTWFNIKRFAVGNYHFDRPEKALDFRGSTEENYNKYVKAEHPFRLAEISKILSKFEKITSVSEYDDPEQNKFFGCAQWRKSEPTSLTFTFNFNPFNYVKKIEEIDYFFNMYHGYSNPFLFVPNVKMKSGKNIIIDIDKYEQFVDEAFSILSEKNSKPIFVPVSMRLNIKEQRKLLEYYRKKEYFNYWLDFEGKRIETAQIGRLRQFNSNIKASGYFDKTILYFTNINREIHSIPNEDLSPASDILASITGANIVGVNRKPQRAIRPIPGQPIPKPKVYPPEHKYRIFDEKSYYYQKSADKNQHFDEINKDINAINLDNEFKSQSEYFYTNLEVEKYLYQKNMLKSYLDGAILRSLLKK